MLFLDPSEKRRDNYSLERAHRGAGSWGGGKSRFPLTLEV